MSLSTRALRRIPYGLSACLVFGHSYPGLYAERISATLTVSAHGGRLQDTVALATITTDTGAFTPGNKEFSRFTTPGMCLGAVDLAREQFRRSVAAQLIHAFQDSAFGGDTLPAGAVKVARACVARFTVSGVATTDLPDLLTLALLAGHDSVANAVLGRRLVLASDNVGRVTVLQEAIDSYLHAEPTRVAAAESIVTRMDALGTSAQAARMNAHATLLVLGMTKFNEPYMRREAERIIALGHEVPASAILYDYLPIIMAYAALGQVAYVETPDSVDAIIARAKQDVGRFPPANEWPPGKKWMPIQALPFKTAPMATVRNALLPFNATQYAGNPLPPVTATYWFPKPPEGWPPGNGQPSLIIYGGWLAGNCVRDDWSLLRFTMRKECLALRTSVPRWVTQYGDRIAITLVAQTKGSAVQSTVLPPAVEADSIAWYLREHLHLPVTVGVVVDSVRKLPEADGRRFHIDPTFYGINYQSSVVLFYGANGTLQYISSNLGNPVLERLIDREMRIASPTPMRQKKS